MQKKEEIPADVKVKTKEKRKLIEKDDHIISHDVKPVYKVKLCKKCLKHEHLKVQMNHIGKAPTIDPDGFKHQCPRCGTSEVFNNTFPFIDFVPVNNLEE